MNLLFDIAHHDAVNMIVIKEDKLFLIDQRSVRKYVMGGIDKEGEEETDTSSCSTKDERRESRE